MKKNKEIKEAAYHHCKEFVRVRLDRLKKQIGEIEEALTQETKSSAGDKHETGRAMLQLEREKLGSQLAQCEKMHEVLHRIKPSSMNKVVGMGALVETDGPGYYIAISAGHFEYRNTLIYCISPATPIGKLLLRKSVGDTFSFNGNICSILSIS